MIKAALIAGLLTGLFASATEADELYYNVRIQGAPGDIQCSELFSDTGFNVVKSCGEFAWPNCFQEIQTGPKTTIETVRSVFEQEKRKKKRNKYEITVEPGGCPE